MKRKLTHFWSTIPSISTKGTMTSHLEQLKTYSAGNQGLGLGMSRIHGRVKPVNGTYPLPNL
jgi:hypothetical protein